MTDYDPLSAKEAIMKQHDLQFSCYYLIDYDLLISSGIPKERIIITLGEWSGSTMIQIASSHPRIEILPEVRPDVVAYIIDHRDDVDDPEIFNRIMKGRTLSENILTIRLLKFLVKKYSSLNEAPINLVNKLLRNIDIKDFILEWMRPLIDYKIENRLRIATNSPMFAVLFPDVHYEIATLSEPGTVIACSSLTTNYRKEKLLRNLQKNYNHLMIDRLYELHKQGFVTSDDIIDYGLHYVYAICDKMIRITSRVKRAL